MDKICIFIYNNIVPLTLFTLYCIAMYDMYKYGTYFTNEDYDPPV